MSYTTAIRALRRFRGWTQSHLANIAGLHQGDVSKIEAGKANIEVGTLESLAAALDAEIVLVPRRVLPSVQTTIEAYLNGANRGHIKQVTSVRDQVFIPDGSDDDETALREKE